MSGVLRITRVDFINIFEAGIKTAEFKFLDELISQWMQKYPNDIEAKFYQAKIDHLQMKDKEASRILKDLLIIDPGISSCL